MKKGQSFYTFIYCMDKGHVVFLMVLLFLGCAVLEGIFYAGEANAAAALQSARKVGKQKRTLLKMQTKKTKNAVLSYRLILGLIFLANLVSVLLNTVFKRSAGSYEVSMTLFRNLIADPGYEENWRTLLMNIFFFFPMGLGGAVALPRKWPVWLRVLIVTVFGFVISCGCEHLQFTLSVGNTELDDVVMNTLGALFGALHIALGEYFAKKETVQRAWAWLKRPAEKEKTA